MAENGIIGALRAVLGMDTASFETGTKRAKGKLTELEGAFKGTSAKIAAAAGATMTAFLAAVRVAVQQAEELKKLSAATGTGVEELSRLKFAAEQSEISFEDLSGAAIRFSARMREMAASVTSDGQRALAALGLSLRDSDGNLKSFIQLLPEVAQALSKYEDGANKAALATAIFGKSGANLIPLLNQGKEGIDELKRKADELGLVFTKDQVDALDDFGDAIALLGKALVHWAADIASKVLPYLTPLAEKIAAVIKAVRDFNPVEHLRTEALLAASKGLRDYVDGLDQMRARIAELEEKRGWFEAAGDVEAVRQINMELKVLTGGVNSAVRAIEEFRSKFGQTDLGLKQWTATVDTAAASARKLQAPDISGWREWIKTVRDELQLFLTEFNTDKILVTSGGIDWNAVLNTQGFDDAMGRIEAAYQHQAITLQQMTAMKLGLARQEQQALLDTASLLASTLTAVFAKNKTAAIAAALINTAVGVTKALSSTPWPLNWVQAALVAATGAAQVAAIRSTNLGGGGSVSAPAASAAAASAPQQLEQFVQIQGIRRDTFLDHEMIRDLIEKLNQANRDGAKLVVQVI